MSEIIDNKFKKKEKFKTYSKVLKKPSKSTAEKSSIGELQAQYENIDENTITNFTDLPLSGATQKGLQKYNYVQPTEIQRQSILLALKGNDVLGAAQTGSGKTLAFLVPVLERLFCNQWTHLDGLGALIITPTRELAYQIFETLKKVGEFHEFSAGLIIGGKDLKFERKRMDKCNIIIGTPGRLLQHMDENPLFDCVNMQILILDEADRCLDMGFEPAMNAIIANLPQKRQTLLFSATQTKSVRDLARLSLKDPKYVSVHEHLEYSTPKNLQQSYVVCELEEKIKILWSFIRNHLKQKTIVFFASCKETKYVYEMFCKLRPGASLLALYGTLHQLRRMEIYEAFCKKNASVLFATDLAARGLDFPEVHWVVQADCPEDSATYIHRVGRTARYHRGGESLLLLLPSETAILDDLQQRKIPIEKIDINPLKLQNPVRKMNAFLAKNVELKATAQRAFVSYVKSVFLMKNKNVFNVNALNTDAFSESLGLEIPPRIRFLQRYKARNQVKQEHIEKIQNNDVEQMEEVQIEPLKNRFALKYKCQTDGGGDLFVLEDENHSWQLPDEPSSTEFLNSIGKKKPSTKIAQMKKMLSKNIAPNKKIVFDDDGEIVNSINDVQLNADEELHTSETRGGIDIEKAKLAIKEQDEFDKKVYREKIKVERRKKKDKLKVSKKEEENSDVEEDSSDENEPDLSWLPDPDQIYGTKENSDGEPAKEDVDTLANTLPTVKKKRKADKDNLEVKNKKNKLSTVAKSLNVDEAEELAMMLLQH